MNDTPRQKTYFKRPTQSRVLGGIWQRAQCAQEYVEDIIYDYVLPNYIKRDNGVKAGSYGRFLGDLGYFASGTAISTWSPWRIVGTALGFVVQAGGAFACEAGADSQRVRRAQGYGIAAAGVSYILSGYFSNPTRPFEMVLGGLVAMGGLSFAEILGKPDVVHTNSLENLPKSKIKKIGNYIRNNPMPFGALCFTCASVIGMPNAIHSEDIRIGLGTMAFISVDIFQYVASKVARRRGIQPVEGEPNYLFARAAQGILSLRQRMRGRHKHHTSIPSEDAEIPEISENLKTSNKELIR